MWHAAPQTQFLQVFDSGYQMWGSKETSYLFNLKYVYLVNNTNLWF